MNRLALAALIPIFALGCERQPVTPVAGESDAGNTLHSGHTAPDSGQNIPDSGHNHVTPDAGSPDAGTDAGITDGGTDAGITDGGTDAGITDGGTDPGGLTWYRDVLPIVQENCQACHVSGGLAPFPLATYQDAFVRHALLANAVSTGRMPPWLPDDSCVPLKGSRRLSATEIGVFVQWSEAGAPAGNPADAPPPPTAAPGLPRVDATLEPREDYTPNAAVTDDYRCFTLPPAFTAQTATNLIGFEVMPGTPHQVHHVILFAAPAADAQNQDDRELGPGWTCYGGPNIPNTTPKMLGGWAPGTGVTLYPEGTGIPLQDGEVIVMQVHYNTSHGTPGPDRTRVKLMYAMSVTYEAMIIPAVDNQFAIPPLSTSYTHYNDAQLQFPSLISLRLWGVTPHMHQLGRRIRVIQNPNTTAQCLIDIPKWDFHWQQAYQYATPLSARGGDTLRIECTWYNPNSTTVTWGEGTADEMCIAFFYVTL
jgi:Copper type II ascorbate-dependent monooxygenase, C-terminal domain/Copper type II ascorbate-dependent monooxygenase, N-terminal domain